MYKQNKTLLIHAYAAAEILFNKELFGKKIKGCAIC